METEVIRQCYVTCVRQRLLLGSSITGFELLVKHPGRGWFSVPISSTWTRPCACIIASTSDQKLLRFAGREILRHHVACAGGKEVGLAQPQVSYQYGFGDRAHRSTCSITHRHDADLRARQPRSHFNESRVRRNGEQPRTGHGFDALTSKGVTARASAAATGGLVGPT